jgi:hypothetical protein
MGWAGPRPCPLRHVLGEAGHTRPRTWAGTVIESILGAVCGGGRNVEPARSPGRARCGCNDQTPRTRRDVRAPGALAAPGRSAFVTCRWTVSFASLPRRAGAVSSWCQLPFGWRWTHVSLDRILSCSCRRSCVALGDLPELKAGSC